jgi:MOSC domain-containing protein YiiM
MTTALTVEGHRYTAHDARATITNLGAWWVQLLAGRGTVPEVDGLLDEQVALLAHALHRPAPSPEASASGPSVAIATIHALGRDAYSAIGDDQLDPALLLGPSLRLLDQATDALRAAGRLPARSTGSVVQLNLSDGGVPKRPVDSVQVDEGGVVGDRQAARRHHGRPWQALSLWSAEVIDAFAADGNPIGYGRCGENVTVRGLPWADVRCGVRLAIGPVIAQVSLFALPCAKNAQWYADGDFTHMHHERGPVSRVYATVLTGGEIRTGDPVVLEP